MKFGAILLDPPWAFRVWSTDTGHGRSAESHYPTMSIEEMCKIDVPSLAADDCAMFCWITWPLLYEAKPMFDAWGFDYKTCAFSWTKVKKSGQVFFGMGYWTRANTEVCLLFTKGSPKRKSKSVRQVIWKEYPEEESILAPFRGHSVKPDEQYTRIEQLVDGPYLEMFARRERPGWHRWGNEVESTVEVLNNDRM